MGYLTHSWGACGRQGSLHEGRNGLSESITMRRERGDVCKHIGDSLCCSAETDTTS